MANESKQISFEIIIPMGNITIGKTKTRLSSILSPVQRKNLTIWLLNHVVINSYLALIDLELKPNITILASEYSKSEYDYLTHLYAINNQLHIKWIGKSLNDSLQKHIPSSNGAKLILPGDLGLLTKFNVIDLVRASESFNNPVIVKAYKDFGTNALLLPNEQVFKFKFGNNSFNIHKELLPKSVTLNQKGLNFDIDNTEDLIELAEYNKKIETILAFTNKIILPKNKFTHVGNGGNSNCYCHILKLPKNYQLIESEYIYANDIKSLELLIN
jgi:2-phospho-L-lactate guanylyltransferase (CobY/MobA/RfbA family)